MKTPKWARQKARELSRYHKKEFYIIYEGGEFDVVSEKNYEDWSCYAQIIASYINGIES